MDGVGSPKTQQHFMKKLVKILKEGQGVEDRCLNFFFHFYCNFYDLKARFGKQVLDNIPNMTGFLRHPCARKV